MKRWGIRQSRGWGSEAQQTQHQAACLGTRGWPRCPPGGPPGWRLHSGRGLTALLRPAPLASPLTPSHRRAPVLPSLSPPACPRGPLEFTNTLGGRPRPGGTGEGTSTPPGPLLLPLGSEGTKPQADGSHLAPCAFPGLGSRSEPSGTWRELCWGCPWSES